MSWLTVKRAGAGPAAGGPGPEWSGSRLATPPRYAMACAMISTVSDTVPATIEDRTASATELARALRIPVGTIWRYAHEGAITNLGSRARPRYDGQEVARVRHARARGTGA